MKSIILLSFLSFSVFSKIVSIPSTKFNYDEVYNSDDGVVWSFAFLSINELLITHRDGKLFYYNLTTKKKESIQIPQVKVKVKGQGGLLDILINKENNKTFAYITFSKEKGDNIITALAKGEVVGNKIASFKTIFEAKVKGDAGYHFGSRLINKDGFLYMTIGDRGERNLAQDPKLHNGKILKVSYDGKAKIYSLGHRNPQGISIDPITKQIYSCEFGPKGGDELNLIKKGVNYGWPIITYGREYYGFKIGTTKKEGLEQPIKYWVPSISPSGMDFYRSQKIADWYGSLFLANLSSTHLRRLVLKNQKVVKEEILFSDLDERIRHVRSGLDENLYFSTDSGKIMRITGIKK